MSTDDSTIHQSMVPAPSPGPIANGSSLKKSWINALVVLVSIEVLAAIGFAGYAIGHSGSSSATGPRITVTSSGVVRGVPDTVEFQIGLHTVRSSEKLALAENNQKVRSLERALLNGYAKKKDLQTSGLNFYANTDYYGHTNGWAVDDNLNVTLHDVSTVGAAIESAVAAGGSGVQLNGVTFSISKKAGLVAKARALAMQNAYTKASQLARAGKTSVGAIIRITDQESQYTPVFYGSDYLSASRAGSSQGVPVQPGSQSVTVTVSVIYSLAN